MAKTADQNRSETMSFVSYAQNFEDVMLWRALKHIKNGFYIDVGAQHPVVDSVSLSFYEHGWRGIHIEPVPFYANLLREHRPDETVIQSAVGERQGVLTFFELPETGLSTANPEIASRHEEAGFRAHEVTVACVTLAEVFSQCLGRDVHWLKIDVEGYERQVLEGWGSEAKPWVVVIESTLPLTQTETYRDWEFLILGLGYKLAYFDGINRFFVSSDHLDLLESFRYGPNFFDGFLLSRSTPFCTALNSEIEELYRLRDIVGTELRNKEHRLAEVLKHLEDKSTEIHALQGELMVSREWLQKAESELVQSMNVRAQLETRLNAREAEILSIYQSISWRFTMPLRKTNSLVKRYVQIMKIGISTLMRVPGRAGRRALFFIVGRVQARPGLRVRMARISSRFPRLMTRLRVFLQGDREYLSISSLPIVHRTPTDPSKRRRYLLSNKISCISPAFIVSQDSQIDSDKLAAGINEEMERSFDTSMATEKES